jgi:trk system potassium uptake protein TrkA
VWRDPSGEVSVVAVAPDEGWIGTSIGDFEAATGTRAGLLTRFGAGQIATPGTLLQAGDTLHVLATDDTAKALRDIAGRPPEGPRE